MHESPQYYAALFLQIASMCSINIFGLISGYVGYGRRRRFSNIKNLWLRVIFWTTLITLIFMLCGKVDITVEILKKALLPITSKTYWYITAYFTVWIVSPLLNIIVERVYTAFIWICLLASLFVLSVVITTSGNNAIWLSLLYVIGATIKKSDFGNKFNLLTGVSGYLLSVYLTWRAIIIQERELFNWNRYVWSFFVGRSDGPWPSSITMVVAAVSILVIGFNLKINNKSKDALIKYTPLILSVYLIHVNPLIFDLLNGAFVALSKLNVVIEVMSILMLSGIIFFICIFLDYWRDKLFAMVKNNIANSK